MSIKLLIGGSPCTYWSIAQTNNRETKADGIGWELFKNYLIAKEKFKPDFFLYENNKSASQAIKDQIAKELGVGVDTMARFTYINSALVSAQNRQRFYVTNFGDIEQPEDRGILLKDILETGTDLTQNRKSYCMTASYDGAAAWNTIERNQRNMVAEPVCMRYERSEKAYCLAANPSSDMSARAIEPVCVAQRGRYEDTGNRSTKGEGGTEQFYEARTDGKTNTLTTVQKDNAVAEPVRVGDLPNQEGKISGSQATRIYDIEGKSVNLVANGGGQGAKTGLYAIPTLIVPENTKKGYIEVERGDCFNYEMPNSKTRRGRNMPNKSNCLTTSCNFYQYFAYATEFDADGKPIKAISSADNKTYTVYEVKDGQITIKGKTYPIKLIDDYYIIRKLTVRECARLQTMPDDYCKAVSATQGYKGLGNGWTAEVIIHLLNHALKDVSRDEEIVVLSMYDGIGTGRYCLEKMGFTNVTYHAYEIDKYPIQIALDNYPDIIEHGDAFAVREDDWKAVCYCGRLD